jgi:hypothetical protein
MNEARPDYRKAFDALWISSAENIERLTAERDEARREVCHEIFINRGGLRPSEYARYRGWDCFKEKAP